MITAFANIWSKEPFYITLENALTRIKNGNSKVKVEEIRNTLDKEKEQVLTQKNIISNLQDDVQNHANKLDEMEATIESNKQSANAIAIGANAGANGNGYANVIVLNSSGKNSVLIDFKFDPPRLSIWSE